jgi:hypothetical protein
MTQEENLRVIREAKQACHVYLTKNGQIEVPDHKTRLAAVALDLAYREGKPVERTEVLHGDAKNFPTLVEKLKQSPAFQALQRSSQNTSGGMITPALAGPSACGVVAHCLLMLSYCGGPILLYLAAEANALPTVRALDFSACSSHSDSAN